MLYTNMAYRIICSFGVDTACLMYLVFLNEMFNVAVPDFVKV